MPNSSHRSCALALLVGLFVLLAAPGASAFNLFGTPKVPATATGVAKLKSELVERAEAVSRGLDETPEQREAITALVEKLEKRNPTKRPTASPLITARWRLIYTTSESILGKTRPSIFRPVGPIYQYINLEEGTARNEEQIRPIPFLPPIDEAIDATIEPASDQRVKVFFQKLILGSLKVDFKSENYLDTTYLDGDMRISRGGRGNTFVLLRDDPQ